MNMNKYIVVNLNNKNQVKIQSIEATPTQATCFLTQPQFPASEDSMDSITSVTTSTTSTKRSSDDLIESTKTLRKRQRLNHLTVDEKLLRRKMKNRIAAQNARDRKKTRMDELEQIVKDLQVKNKNLKNENQQLKVQTERLLAENCGLKDQLKQQEHRLSSGQVKNEFEPNSNESAVFLLKPVSQQQKQVQTQFINLILPLLTCLMLRAVKCPQKIQPTSIRNRTTLSSANLVKIMLINRTTLSSANLVKIMLIKHLIRRLSQRQSHQRARLQGWWGPQQQTWNACRLLAFLMKLRNLRVQQKRQQMFF
jgi:hypothetical protein